MSAASRITAQVHAGWREPLFALANLLRAGGRDDHWWRDWDAAVTLADRTVSVTGWSTALQPGFDQVDLGMQPVLVPAGRLDRSRARAHFYNHRSVEARRLGYARLTVPVQLPQEWTRLPGAVFRLHAVSAILDTLLQLGRSAGIGPPPLRARPSEPDPETMVDDTALIRSGRWWERERDATPAGHAVVAARTAMSEEHRARREEFVARLGDVERVASGGDFEAWRVGPIVNGPTS